MLLFYNQWHASHRISVHEDVIPKQGLLGEFRKHNMPTILVVDHDNHEDNDEQANKTDGPQISLDHYAINSRLSVKRQGN